MEADRKKVLERSNRPIQERKSDAASQGRVYYIIVEWLGPGRVTAPMRGSTYQDLFH